MSDRLNVMGRDSHMTVDEYAQRFSQTDRTTSPTKWDPQWLARFNACDHQWSEPQPVEEDAAAHHCARCDTWLYIWPWSELPAKPVA